MRPESGDLPNNFKLSFGGKDNRKRISLKIKILTYILFLSCKFLAPYRNYGRGIFMFKKLKNSNLIFTVK